MNLMMSLMTMMTDEERMKSLLLVGAGEVQQLQQVHASHHPGHQGVTRKTMATQKMSHHVAVAVRHVVVMVTMRAPYSNKGKGKGRRGRRGRVTTSSAASPRNRVRKEHLPPIVTAKIIRETGDRYPTCKCEDMDIPLEPGIYIDDLYMLGSGCTAGLYVCPRLDAVRRRLGK